MQEYEEEIIENFILKNRDLIQMYIASVVEASQPLLNQRNNTNINTQSMITNLYIDLMTTLHDCVRNNCFNVTTSGNGYGMRLTLNDTCEWVLEIYPHIRTLTFPFQNMPENLIKQIQDKLEVEDKAIT